MGSVKLRSRSDRLRPVLLGALAFVCVLVSHYLAYRLAAPDPHYRDALLHSTGHRYFVFVAGGLLGLLSAAAAVWLRADAAGLDTRRAGFRFALPRLLVLQVGGFLSLEAGERLLFGGGVSHLPVEAPVLIGLVLQLLVAVVGALSLVLVVRAVERFLKRRQTPEVASRAPELPPALHVLPLRSAILTGGGAPRAPPALAR